MRGRGGSARVTGHGRGIVAHDEAPRGGPFRGNRVATMATTRCAMCGSAEARTRTRNVVLFVADGLRPSSLNPTDAPTLVRLQKEGVFFANSHSLYPTVTTANASALATGHQLGDTGDFANALYTGSQVINSGTPFIEDDEILAELDAQTGGNYLGEQTLLAVARAHGFSTAAIGKVGPTLIQDVSQGDRSVKMPATIFLDDRTGTGKGVPLDPAIATALTATLGSATPPARNSKPPTPRRQWLFGEQPDAGDPRGQRPAATVPGRRRHQGDPPRAQEAGKTVRAGVLVARSGRHAAQSRRQPGGPRHRHQRADLAQRGPQRRRHPAPHPRGGGGRSRARGDDRRRRDLGPRLFDHQPTRRRRRGACRRRARRRSGARPTSVPAICRRGSWRSTSPRTWG